ncbi:MAG: 6-carboxytetrahydropterin synthase [candidate division KSB1 bacterium]|nr:6-carboxytetrahydropterin synthase [candidate division KSB1 bacterium]
MPIVYVTRKIHFSAAHRLHSDKLSEDENRRIYGLCNNPLGHGHNYEVEVTVCGEPDPITGMVIDLKELKEILERRVAAPMDHKHLNEEVDFLAGVVPTAENIAVAIWHQIEGELPKGKLYEVKVYETERNIAVYRGE